MDGLKAFLEAMPTSVMVVNEHGRVVVANIRASEFLDHHAFLARSLECGSFACGQEGLAGGGADLAVLCRSCWRKVFQELMASSGHQQRRLCFLGEHPCQGGFLQRSLVTGHSLCLNDGHFHVLVVELSDPTNGERVSVCAYCQRVRDRAGLWQPFSYFVSQHFMVSVTHGICPECIRLGRF
nr:PAS domain-containing protein [uncultured Holophaga sp.]